jgi:hypothetical protein
VSQTIRICRIAHHAKKPTPILNTWFNMLAEVIDRSSCFASAAHLHPPKIPTRVTAWQ